MNSINLNVKQYRTFSDGIEDWKNRGLSKDGSRQNETSSSAQQESGTVLIPEVLYEPRTCSCFDEVEEGRVLAEEYLSARAGIMISIGKLQAWACRTGCSEVPLGESGKAIIIPGNKRCVFNPDQFYEVFILQYGMTRTD